jgi:hypothetical protein
MFDTRYLYREIGLRIIEDDKEMEDEILKEFDRFYANGPIKGWTQYDILCACIGIYKVNKK